MLIDEELRKCATHLLVVRVNPESGVPAKEPAATAFFVNVPLEGIDAEVGYAVTARHVIDMSGKYGPLYVRLNKTDGGFQDLECPQDQWTCHPTTDVAVIRVYLPGQGWDLRSIPASMFLTNDKVGPKEIGVGDEVFFVGLFALHPGRERVQPIIRFGNISLMPVEKVQVKMPGSTEIDAYLVEARSWGGHSGSPCFVYYPPDRKWDRLHMPMIGAAPPIDLLGLVHGHYEIEQDVAFVGDILGSGKVPVNAGVAVVVPAQAIWDTLMDSQLVEERHRVAEQVKAAQPTPSADQGAVGPTP